jgi:polyhydroxybutyrate depolymerase
MAWSTGLARRGPAAGITTVFPDGWKGGWHAARPPADQPDLDDARFLAELALYLEGTGAARSWPVFLTGLAQGARYAEHVARNALLPVTGLFLVAGTTLELSRRQVPVPQLHASMTLVLGTGDKTTPYAGGPLTRAGLSGLVRRRRAARHGERPGEDAVAGAEGVVADWVTVNGLDGGTAGPVIAELPGVPGDATVTRKAWARPGCHPVTLYRIDGGGHGWPGGPQLWSARLLGPATGQLDATGLLLAMAERQMATAYGRPALDPGPAC